MTVSFRVPGDPVDLNEPDLLATFVVDRGAFEVPAAVLEAADAGDDYPLRRLFAVSLPERVDGDVLETRRLVRRDGSARVTWRHIIVRVRPA